MSFKELCCRVDEVVGGKVFMFAAGGREKTECLAKRGSSIWTTVTQISNPFRLHAPHKPSQLFNLGNASNASNAGGLSRYFANFSVREQIVWVATSLEVISRTSQVLRATETSVPNSQQMELRCGVRYPNRYVLLPLSWRANPKDRSPSLTFVPNDTTAGRPISGSVSITCANHIHMDSMTWTILSWKSATDCVVLKAPLKVPLSYQNYPKRHEISPAWTTHQQLPRQRLPYLDLISTLWYRIGRVTGSCFSCWASGVEIRTHYVCANPFPYSIVGKWSKPDGYNFTARSTKRTNPFQAWQIPVRGVWELEEGGRLWYVNKSGSLFGLETAPLLPAHPRQSHKPRKTKGILIFSPFSEIQCLQYEEHPILQGLTGPWGDMGLAHAAAKDLEWHPRRLQLTLS
jgi:hypothetical protein